MTEQRPAYHAFTEEVEGSLVEDDAPTSRIPNVLTPPDTIILVPMLQSGQTMPATLVCLHLVHLDHDVLGLCSTPTSLRCPCCMNPVCVAHQSSRRMLFPDQYMPTRSAPPLLCETCATLSHLQMHALHATLLNLNARKDHRHA